ncbi:pentatricopeptide repeat-containing protein At2g03880, mitochondrial [Cryptomeria japonica]|uniref:pentatricopeptide repeat-containing protein At2g03880, mitochondrial n=1 Tax=Cryptomeria japonica TaxID=3369 RepID=UPI0027DA7E7B|nr:pentatricopeptide repeat-containing protein At2g03880, mitochondrial [Cryptomeria japonica]
MLSSSYYQKKSWFFLAKILKHNLRVCRSISCNAIATDFTDKNSNIRDFNFSVHTTNFLHENVRLSEADTNMYGNLLQECVKMKRLLDGKILHSHMIESGFEPDIFVYNNLINMYARCGSILDARQVFDRMAERSVVTWNAMITGYVQSGYGVEAWKVFREMRKESNADLRETNHTITSLLKACSVMDDVEMGRQVHGVVVKSGIELNVFARSAMVDMYAKCGRVDDARQVFDKMAEQNVVLWTAMIAGYVQCGQGEEALNIFADMLKEGVNVNQFTFSSAFGACAIEGGLEQGKQVHAMLVKSDSELDVFVLSALVDMYAKCENMEDACRVFDRTDKRSEVLWTAMITGYAQNGLDQEALQLFEEMLWVGMKPNNFTFANALRACASLVALELGRQVHSHVIKSGYELNLFPASTLVDMYAKCGNIEDALEVFEAMPKRNVVSWNAMITGCAQHGLGKEALKFFEQMKQEGTDPDHITFVGVLSACSHAGLVEQGRKYFDSMGSNYGIEVRQEHYVCMVDLLARAGLLDEAEHFINSIALPSDPLIWRTLLSACRIYSNIELGIRAAKNLLHLEPYNASTYVLLSNMYASLGKWDDRAHVSSMMEKMRIGKDPGSSWIIVQNKVHTFVVGDISHPQTDEIYANMESLAGKMKEAGYVAETNSVLHDMEEENKEYSVGHHSEKLAIVFGLMSSSPGTPIRVFKNLRVCADCHKATKFISKLVEREIIVRDANRFHHFKEGLCSCGDYW